MMQGRYLINNCEIRDGGEFLINLRRWELNASCVVNVMETAEKLMENE